VKFDVTTVSDKLQKLNRDKSPGSDGIHLLLLKECARVLAEPLLHFSSNLLIPEYCQMTGKLLIEYQFSRKEIVQTEQTIVQLH